MPAILFVEDDATIAMGVEYSLKQDGFQVSLAYCLEEARSLVKAGADVVVINASPDGRNINAGCGALHPSHVAAEVKSRGAALGVTFDGDADRRRADDFSPCRLVLPLESSKQGTDTTRVGVPSASRIFCAATAISTSEPEANRLTLASPEAGDSS